jgi:hypothetical protein
MVEQPGPWGHDALVQSALPPDVGATLKTWEQRLGIRVLLIQRRDRPTAPSRRCFASFTGRKERRLATFELSDPRELFDLDVESQVRMRWQGFGEHVARPLFLICTHGKHDRCCARYGGPVSRVLAHRPDVWECTHVGGDRFAANMVCFPDGVYFGRVTPGTATGLVEGYERGSIVLEHFRGRSSFAPAVQAAERELRIALGLVHVDDLSLERHDRTDAVHRVVFRIPDGRKRTVEVREARLDKRLLTCKAQRAGSPRTFLLERIS